MYLVCGEALFDFFSEDDAGKAVNARSESRTEHLVIPFRRR